MNQRNFLAVAAVVAFIFGIGFVLFPGQLMPLYGVTLDAVGTVVGQLFGAALIGFGVMNWLARGVHQHDAASLRPVLMGNLASNGIGFIMALLGQLGGQTGVNALGWSTVLIYLLLAAGFAYFLFVPQAKPVAAAPR